MFGNDNFDNFKENDKTDVQRDILAWLYQWHSRYKISYSDGNEYDKPYMYSLSKSSHQMFCDIKKSLHII